MPTTCATSVLGVCGWALAPRTAHPRVGSALGSFTWGQCSAVSDCAAHYHTAANTLSVGVRGIEPSFSIVGAHAIIFDTNLAPTRKPTACLLYTSPSPRDDT